MRYSAPSPDAAAIAANTVVQAYIDTTLELNVTTARSSSEWLDEQTQRLTANMQAARAKLADFQQRTGIVGTRSTIGTAFAARWAWRYAASPDAW